MALRSSDPAVAGGGEADPLVVGPDHRRGGDDAREAVVAKHPAAAPDERAWGEVTEARADPVEVDVRRAVTAVVEQHDADRLVAALDEEGAATVSAPVPRQVGLVDQHVLLVHVEHVPEVRVGRPDLEHLEGGLVVARGDQRADVPEIDRSQGDVHRHHRPDAERCIEACEHDAGGDVEHPEAEHPGLHD